MYAPTHLAFHVLAYTISCYESAFCPWTFLERLSYCNINLYICILMTISCILSQSSV